MSLKMGLLGRKIGMTQVFHEDGSALGRHRRLGRALRRGRQAHRRQARLLAPSSSASRRSRCASLTRPQTGYFKKAGVEKPLRFLREVRLEAKDLDKYEVGKVLRAAEVFKSGDVVDVVGTTKGKGYQGVMKRHHMAGDSATHGTHEFFRHGGSIGCRLTPGRVHKGKRMSGHMGNVKNTVVRPGHRQGARRQGPRAGQGRGPRRRPTASSSSRAASRTSRSTSSRGPIKEVESKNPMKASKKGAPGRRQAPRSSRAVRATRRRLAAVAVQAPRSAPPPRRVLQAARERGFRGALGLQARGDRPASCACCGRAIACSTSAAGPGSWLQYALRRRRAARRGGRASIATRCRRPSRARASSRRHLRDARRRAARRARRRSTSCSRTWRPTRPACARPIRRARRRCSSGRSSSPSGCSAPGGDFVGKLFQGPDLEALRKRMAARFSEVRTIKPESSRAQSIEIYLAGKGFQ